MDWENEHGLQEETPSLKFSDMLPSCRDDDVSLKFVKRSVLVVGLISCQNEGNNMISTKIMVFFNVSI